MHVPVRRAVFLLRKRCKEFLHGLCFERLASRGRLICVSLSGRNIVVA